jgi:hypothetical protein
MLVVRGGPSAQAWLAPLKCPGTRDTRRQAWLRLGPVLAPDVWVLDRFCGSDGHVSTRGHVTVESGVWPRLVHFAIAFWAGPPRHRFVLPHTQCLPRCSQRARNCRGPSSGTGQGSVELRAVPIIRRCASSWAHCPADTSAPESDPSLFVGLATRVVAKTEVNHPTGMARCKPGWVSPPGVGGSRPDWATPRLSKRRTEGN